MSQSRKSPIQRGGGGISNHDRQSALDAVLREQRARRRHDEHHRGDADSPLTLPEDDDDSFSSSSKKDNHDDDDSDDDAKPRAVVLPSKTERNKRNRSTLSPAAVASSTVPVKKDSSSSGQQPYPIGTPICKFVQGRGKCWGRLVGLPTAASASGDPIQVALVTMQNQNPPETYKSAISTLYKMLSNIIQNPFEEKYRSVKETNPAFSRRLGDVTGGHEALLACGFALNWNDNDQKMVYVLNASADASWPALLTAKSKVEAAKGADMAYRIEYNIGGYLEDISSLEELDCIVAAAEGASAVRRYHQEPSGTTILEATALRQSGKRAINNMDNDYESLLDSSSSDEESVSVLAAPARKKIRRTGLNRLSSVANSQSKRARVGAQQRSSGKERMKQRLKGLWDDDDDDDADETGSMDGAVVSRLANQVQNTRRKKYSFYEHLPTKDNLSAEKQATELASIEKPANRALQKLLFATGRFRMILKEHQFMAVCKVAGVPEMFPMHQGSQVGSADTATLPRALQNLPVDSQCRNRGVLLADEMGLGKTIEAIAGLVLRNAMAAERGDKKRPSLIVGPNHAVLRQWRDALVQNGFPRKLLRPFKKGQDDIDLNQDVIFFATRYDLQGELKSLFDEIAKLESPSVKNMSRCVRTSSVLWPCLSREILYGLWLQFLSDRGDLRKFKVHNTDRRKGEYPCDCISRLVANCLGAIQNHSKAVFETVFIDEAHFLKNRCAYWGIAGALLCAHSRRCIPMTGTPFCNGPGDLASMKALIDPRMPAARTPWWKEATSGSSQPADVIRQIQHVTKTYIVRREKADVLKDMVKKYVRRERCRPYNAELSSYKAFEANLLGVLEQFVDLITYEFPEDPTTQAEKNRLFRQMMCLMSGMRAASIHPMLPAGGEWSIKFSPTRRHLADKETCRACVCCSIFMRPTVPLPVRPDGKNYKRGASNKDVNPNLEDFENGIDDDELSDFSLDDDTETVIIPSPVCTSTSGLRHYAHVDCLKKMQQENSSCPRCLHASNIFKLDYPGCTRYCENVDGGFPGSTTIDAVVRWCESVHNDDKALIFSFSKKSLHLIEGILHSKGIGHARFDGDFPRTRDAELRRFKKDPNCKFLLMTVQSGGVGLNIVEANHVAFLDRWYNPFVHVQGEDRCHRIGQEKDVHVTYFDSCATLDDAMFHLNEAKKDNSAILLADGMKIGSAGQKLTYQDLTGFLMNHLKIVRAFRSEWLSGNPQNAQAPIPVIPDKILARKDINGPFDVFDEEIPPTDEDSSSE